jgi:hypothetical protein
MTEFKGALSSSPQSRFGLRLHYEGGTGHAPDGVWVLFSRPEGGYLWPVKAAATFRVAAGATRRVALGMLVSPGAPGIRGDRAKSPLVCTTLSVRTAFRGHLGGGG